MGVDESETFATRSSLKESNLGLTRTPITESIPVLDFPFPSSVLHPYYLAFSLGAYEYHLFTYSTQEAAGLFAVCTYPKLCTSSGVSITVFANESSLLVANRHLQTQRHGQSLFLPADFHQTTLVMDSDLLPLFAFNLIVGNITHCVVNLVSLIGISLGVGNLSRYGRCQRSEHDTPNIMDTNSIPIPPHSLGSNQGSTPARCMPS